MIYGGAQFGKATPKSNKTNHSENSETRPAEFNSVLNPLIHNPPSGSTRYPTTRIERTPMALPASVPARVVYEKNWAKNKETSMVHGPLPLSPEKSWKWKFGYTWKVTAIEWTHFFHFHMGGRVSGNPNQQKTMAAESTVFLLDPNEGDELKVCWIHQQWDWFT